MADRALKGKTVVVTRPRAQARQLCELLRSHGARVLAAPTIRVAPPSTWKPLDCALRRLGDYDTVIFTSANAVSIFFKRAQKILRDQPRRRGQGAPTFPRRPAELYAIGPRTAAALESRGWLGVQIPETFEGRALARFLGSVRGRTILIPRARVARDILPRLLRRKGAKVDVVEAYRTVPDPSGLRILRRIVRHRGADIVTFTSSSTAESFVSAVKLPAARNFFHSATAASIGPITSAALRKLGIRRIAEARVYTAQGLVQAILDHEAKNRT